MRHKFSIGRAVFQALQHALRLFLSCLLCACAQLKPLDEARATGPIGKVVDINGAGIFVQERPGPWPDAPVAVLVHGFASSSSTWDAIAPVLARSHRVIGLDLPGYGMSSRPQPGAMYTVDGQIAAIAAVLDRMGVGRFDLVGHSYGGFLALRWVAVDRGRIRSVCAIAPPDPSIRVTPRIQPVLAAIMYPYARYLIGSSSQLERLLALAYGPGAPVPAGIAEAYRRRLAIAGFARFYFGLVAAGQGSEPAWQPERIHVPVALIWGRQDRIVGTVAGPKLRELIAGSRLYILDGGHMIHETAAPAVARLIIKTWAEPGR